MRSRAALLFLIFGFGAFGAQSGKERKEFAPAPRTTAATAKRNVLILNSYHQSYPFTDEEVRGIESVLAAEPYEVETWTEYLDTKRFSGSGHFDRMRGLLAGKYAGIRMDLIVATDDDAVDFLLRYREELFGNTPVVFCGVSGADLLARVNRDFYTGVVEVFDSEAIMREALRYLPQARKIVVVTDGTANNAVHLTQMMEVANRHPELTFEFLDGRTMPFLSILERLRDLSPDSIVIATMFTHDNVGVYLPPEISEAELASASPVPIFSPNTSQLGQGFLLGKSNRGYAHGRMAGQIAARVLRGEKPGAIALQQDGGSTSLVDYRVLKKWGLSESALQPGSLLLNQPDDFPQFYKAHRVAVLSGIAFILCQSLIIAGLIVNRTRRRNAEKALRKSQALLEMSQRMARLGSWELDTETGKMFWSDECFRIHGIEPGAYEPTYPQVIEFAHADDRERVRSSAISAEATKSARSLEYRIVRPNGEIRYIRNQVEWAEGKRGKTRIAGTIQDITERREMEEQFHRAQHAEALGNLAGGIAHDFNNLLTVINGYCEVLLARPETGEMPQASLLEIRKAGQRASDLTRKLLALGRRQVHHPEPLDPNELVRSMTGLLNPVFGESIELRLELAPGLGVIQADRGQLEQALLNLATNARDAMPNGGTVRIVTSDVEVRDHQSAGTIEIRPGSYVSIAMIDTGDGMDDSTLRRIFEPFFTTKQVGKGTGLGLASVYSIVQQNRGHLKVQSEVGAGSTFQMIFPRNGDGAGTLSAEQREAAQGGGGEVILLAEDDEQIRKLTEQTLTNLGYRVLSAAGAEQALKLAEGFQGVIDLLVTDVVMPKLNGVQLADCLRSTRAGLPVLYISGYAGDRLPENRLGARDSFLPKPFSPDQLSRRIRQIFDAAAAKPAADSSQ